MKRISNDSHNIVLIKTVPIFTVIRKYYAHNDLNKGTEKIVYLEFETVN
jgi:hypothetical protein